MPVILCSLLSLSILERVLAGPSQRDSLAIISRGTLRLIHFVQYRPGRTHHERTVQLQSESLHLAMKTSRYVTLCWLAVAFASVSMLFSFIASVIHPTLQMSYSAQSGEVRDVFAGGAAERAGLRPGDRIVALGGEPLGSRNPLFNTRARVPLSVTFQRGSVMRSTTLLPPTQEEDRRQAFRAGGGRALWAASSYLVFPVSIWMLTLGIGLLALRPEDRDARSAALVFIFWTGGNFIGTQSGMGTILSALPPLLQVVLLIFDSLFVALFFAACVHFALIFASGEQRLRTRVIAVPYLLSLPIFLESALQSLDRVAALRGRLPLFPRDDFYSVLGPLLLVSAMVVLVFRLRRTSEVNTRRRLQLIFIALLPGVAAFILIVLLDRLEAPYTWRQTGRLLQWLGTVASSLIFATAIVRHRMFGIRLLVRRSIQYALARRTLMIATVLPVIALILFLYHHRDDSLRRLLTARPGVYLAILLPLVLALRYRARLLDALDRRYFREQYDARQMLLHVVSMIRSGSDSMGVARAALTQIGGALHPAHIALWRPDPLESELRREIALGTSTDAPHLAIASSLVALLAADDEPFDIEMLKSSPVLRRLPASEREWLVATGAHLLVPVRREEQLHGLLLLGGKLSEEPYSREDRELLRVLCGQLAATFHESRTRSSPSMVWNPAPEASLRVSDEMSVCPDCKRCYSSQTERCEVDGASLQREEGVPFQIEEKYDLKKLLGRGGMGSVFLARQRRLNRPVAIKILLAHLVGSSNMRSRFEREARIIARLSHIGIVTVHDFGVLPNSHAYLVMEYLEGKTLRALLGNKGLPYEEMMRIMRPVGDAVHAAHQAGVVHRDLKPDNIIVLHEYGKPPIPKVLDFGLARLQELPSGDDATLPHPTQSGSIVGTLPYMAPELLSGKTADARSDQYSLGLIVYEMLTGAHPFEGRDLASIVVAHTQTPVPPLWEKVRIEDEHAAAVHRALSKNPDDRFATTADFIEALEA